MKKLSLIISILLLALTFTPSLAQTPEGEEYIVQADDWLSTIAEKTYGDVLAFPAIVVATNAKAAEDDSFAVITDPGIIEAGQKLWLPLAPELEGLETSSSPGTVGAPGIGDPIFPLAGNGGIDVQHYALDITWDDQSGAIDAVATLAISATQDLSAFNLDFHGLEISDITINDAPATFSRAGDELTITPAELINSGQAFTTTVAYNGVPSAPEGIIGTGWTTFEEGVYVLSEPTAAKNWFPNNNHPRDRASYSFSVTVPTGYDVVANGVPGETVENGDSRTFSFVANDSMASYLASVSIDQFERQDSSGPNGLPIINYFFTGAPAEQTAAFDRFPEMIEAFAARFGPYPFEVAGNVLIDVDLNVALEVQTRAMFGTFIDEQVVAHELGHQWFGDSVTLERWNDVWLKEGFARYSEGLWIEHKDGPEAMVNWVTSYYEQLLGVSTIPLAGLAAFLETLGIPETNLSPEQVGSLLDLPFSLIDANGIATPTEISAAEREAVLSQIPEAGISNRELESLLEALPVAGWHLPLNDAVQFNLIMSGIDPAQAPAISLEDVAAQIAAPPALVQTQEQLYTGGTYNRGAMSLHALRLRLSDDVFFDVVRSYVARYSGGSAGVDEFMAVAEEISGEDLDAFFSAWLEDTVVPDIPEMGLFVEDFQ